MSDKVHIKQFTGGLNLTHPALALSASDLIYCKNMEPSLYGGYKQVSGFERFDGRTKPSETVYSGITPDDYFYETSANQTLYDAQRETNRTAIQTVPGDGDVLGVAIYSDTVYAFRGDSGTLKCYKNTASGWSHVTQFTGLTANGTNKVQTVVYNFGSGPRLYGVDGVNDMWEWDSSTSTFTSITGLAGKTVKPWFLAAHGDYLFVDYGNSVAHSKINAPTDWTTGTAEFNVKGTVTGITHLKGGLLSIFCSESTNTLYGSTDTDFNMVVFSDSAGAQAYTVASEVTPVYVSDQGVTSLQAVDAYGDFQTGSFTNKILPWLQKYKANAVGAILDFTAMVYRLYFSDGRVLNLGFDGQKAGDALMSEYGKNFTCVVAGEVNNEKVIFAGAEDGYVYQMEVGYCLDGAEIPVLFKTAFDNCGSPYNMKSFTYMEMLVDAPDEVTINYSPDFSFGSVNTPSATTDSLLATGGGAWDISDWDSFLWSEQTVGVAEGYFDGKGENYNVAMVVSMNTQYTRPVTFQSLSYFYTLDGNKR